MKVNEIIWLDTVVEKLWRKHQVARHEVGEILRGRPASRLVEKGHRRGEDLYVAFGQTHAGRYLSVFFVLKSGKRALVVSAREMTRRERRRRGQK